MIGLDRAIVQLVPHDPEWALLFAEEKTRIGMALGSKAVDIQHIGSTSVPGLDAKPILDIAVAVADVPTVAECVPELEALGYTYYGDRYERGDFFFAKGDEQNRTHYLHMTEHASSEWVTMLRFRDQLIANPMARQSYSDLKNRLWQEHASNRKAYTEGKAEFIQLVLREASAE